MKPTHLGISNFRSIGSEPVTVDLAKKVTVVVGANNCGKSNVLRALEWLYSQSDKKQWAEVDHHARTKEFKPKFHLSLVAESNDHQALRRLEKITVQWSGLRNNHEKEASCENFACWSPDEFYQITNATLGYYYNSRPTREQMQKTCSEIAAQLIENGYASFPYCVVIPQFREIRTHDTYSIEGAGIVKLLASWHHPPIGKDQDHEKFQKVESLIRKLLETPDIHLEVSHQQDEIIIKKEGLRLPLSSFGTGIHELIILSIAVLSKSQSLVCIEEPEIHLHPLLQRKFLEFLRKETDNRYVITTHSSALISPAPDTDVIHLWMENGVTQSRRIEASADALRALRDLGVRASDILQANSVIWVEGPSDRVYLNRWIALEDPELREGIDYSIMFYGGRLLSHLSLQREETWDADELISLLRINQHSAILIDSDRSKGTDEINATKKRVVDECTKSGVLCWVTDGREIENSLPVVAIESAYHGLTQIKPPTALRFNQFSRLDDAIKKWLSAEWKPKWSYNESKPQIARLIAPHISKENLEAKVAAHVHSLVRMIQNSG